MRENLARLVLSQSCSLFFKVVSLQVADHFVDVVLEGRDFAERFHRDGARQVAFRHGGGHFRDGAHLGGQVGRELVDVIGQIFPGSGGARHAGLAAQFSFDTDFARHGGHLIGECGQRVRHVVDGFGQFGDFALGFHRQFALEVAIGHGRHDDGDAAHLVGQIAGHQIHVIRQVLPGSGDALHLGLAAEFSFGADFARHARHFGGERAKLIHHRVDGVLQFQDFAAARPP